ncbi:taste receptor type 2 member 39-like [Hyla sarda]|uniref:taste receptor type 2 member 39-like n=1 Tax=Hyla sarda TaxID=327740 RepID=UPI0024C3635B|nr:taste receptor type 2 member 39-like [Hyla sarda]
MEMFLAILLLEVISSLSFSVFTIICLSRTGVQRANITPLNRILISLNVSNVFYTIFMSAYLLLSNVWSYLFSIRSVSCFISSMTMFAITSSTWLTAVLCFFFFMKIIPSRPGLLMNFKNEIGSIIWKLILMVIVVSAGGSFITALFISLQHPNVRNSTMNEVKTLEENIRQKPILVNFVVIFNWLPFLVIIMTTVASAWFLKVYDSQMKKNNGTLAKSNVKDYLSAVYTMTGLLFFYIFVIVAVVIFALKIFVHRSVGYWICEMALLSFPTGQSILLIYSNPRLKQILKEIFTDINPVVTPKNAGRLGRSQEVI